MKVEPAINIRGEDCQGRPENFWRATSHSNDGKLFLGHGPGPSEAEAEAARKATEHEAFIAQSPEDQLRQLVDSGYLLSDNVNWAIQLIAQIILRPKPINGA